MFLRLRECPTRQVLLITREASLRRGGGVVNREFTDRMLRRPGTGLCEDCVSGMVADISAIAAGESGGLLFRSAVLNSTVQFNPRTGGSGAARETHDAT